MAKNYEQKDTIIILQFQKSPFFSLRDIENKQNIQVFSLCFFFCVFFVTVSCIPQRINYFSQSNKQTNKFIKSILYPIPFMHVTTAQKLKSTVSNLNQKTPLVLRFHQPLDQTGMKVYNSTWVWKSVQLNVSYDCVKFKRSCLHSLQENANAKVS